MCVDLSWKDIGGCGRPKVRVDNSTCVVCVWRGRGNWEQKGKKLLIVVRPYDETIKSVLGFKKRFYHKKISKKKDIDFDSDYQKPVVCLPHPTG